MSWTADKTVRLKHLWKVGYTATEIGEKLNYSKNAVIGRAHRLNLDARRSRSGAGEPRTTYVRSTRAQQIEALLNDKNFEPENPTQLEGLTKHHCRWPEGEPGKKDFYFCGRTPVKGFSYCRLHILKSTKPRSERNIPEKVAGLLPTTP